MQDAEKICELGQAVSRTEAKSISDIEQICELGRAVIETEAKAIRDLTARIDHHFATACRYLLNCEGRIIVMGMGKSGHIGKKIAATFASTGSPAFFVHPGEAKHGDFGMITHKDVVLALSNSGETEEIVTILPFIKRLDIPLIAITGKPLSTLALTANINLNISVEKEACPLGLAPTASTTATLVMGDALAISLLQKRGFTSEDFALSHPGGTIGRRLLLKVDQIMHTGDAIPKVSYDAFLKTALVEITQKKLGMTTVLDANNKLSGIFTDGDLRRAFDRNDDVHITPIHQIMTKNPKVISQGILAAEALHIMETHKITALIIVDENQHPIGVVHLHDILRAGVI
ncbi:MAG: KpsF/GutQ family sugar-phosphate isomerase [Gammaproteobacteria bacterium]|nr:KpsF/GutQ family sugar-phosphate isomerase [Gammaproteobacteria bacterium]